MVPCFQSCAASCTFGCCCCCRGCWRVSVEGKFCQVTLLITRPTERPPALNGNYYLLKFVCYDVWNSMETLLIYINFEKVVSVCRRIYWSHWCHLLHVAICAQVGSEDVSVELCWDIAHDHPDSLSSFKLWLELEVFRGDVGFTASSADDSRTAFPVTVPALESCCPEEIFKWLIFKASQSPGSVTMNDRIMGSTSTTSSGMGTVVLSLKYGAYLLTLSFSYSSGDFLLTAPKTSFARLLLAGVFVPMVWN